MQTWMLKILISRLCLNFMNFKSQPNLPEKSQSQSQSTLLMNPYPVGLHIKVNIHSQ